VMALMILLGIVAHLVILTVFAGVLLAFFVTTHGWFSSRRVTKRRRPK
jgi:hypothetical protein